MSDRAGAISIADIWQALTQSWRMILAITVTTTFLGILYLLQLKPSYQAEMTIANAQFEAFGSASGASAVGALSQLAGVSSPGSEKFLQFQTMMKSNSVAVKLARDKVVRNVLMQPQGIFRKSIPSTADLRKTISAMVKVTKVDEGTATVSLAANTPQNAVYLLTAIYSAADSAMRSKAASTSSAKIDYLLNAISRTTNSSNREVLIELLAREQVQLMFSKANTPYAATVLDPAIVPTRPVSKKMIVLAVSVISGVFIGMIIALWKRNVR